MPLTSRPTAEEIIDGVQSTLTAHVLPALPEDAAVARNRLTSAAGMLAYLRERWDGTVQELVEEIESLEQFLDGVVAPLHEHGHAELGTRIAQLAAGEAEDLRVSTLMQRSDDLQAGLFDLFLLVDREHDGGGALGTLRPRVLEALAGYNRRRLPGDGGRGAPQR